MKQFRRSAEESQLPAECNRLSYNGGPRNTLNAPFEHEDEERVEYAVNNNSEECAPHSRARMTGTTQYRVRAKVEMRYHIAKQNDEHILSSVG